MKRCLIAVLSLSMLGIVGCGGGSGGSESSTASDREQIQTLVDDYSQASLDGDAKAVCGLLSSEALETINKVEQFDGCEEVAEYGFRLLDDQQKAEIAEISDIQVDGDEATAEGRDGPVSFTKEDGEWKLQAQNEGG